MTYNDGSQDLTGFRPQYTPAHTVNGWLTKSWKSGFTASLGGHYQGSMFTDNEDFLRLGGWTTFGGAVSYRLQHWDLSVNAENVFNRQPLFHGFRLFGSGVSWVTDQRLCDDTLSILVNKRLKRLAIFLHRWLGVTFCLLFAWWFLSGIFMMYGDYPRVSAADRLARAPALDVSRIHVDPEAAYRNLAWDQAPDQLRLTTYDGRPAYRFRVGREESLVFADDGQVESQVFDGDDAARCRGLEREAGARRPHGDSTPKKTNGRCQANSAGCGR